MKIFKNVLFLPFVLMLGFAQHAHAGPCDYPWQLDARGYRCGKRAKCIRPGGKLDGQCIPPPGKNLKPSPRLPANKNQKPAHKHTEAHNLEKRVIDLEKRLKHMEGKLQIILNKNL